MKLSVIVPSYDGQLPISLAWLDAFQPDVEVIVVKGVSPVGAARNEGLKRAKGDFVAWVDSDDDIVPAFAPEIMAALRSSPDLVTFDTRIEWHDGSGRPAYSQSHRTNDFERDYLRGKLPGQLWCKVFRRTLFEGKSFSGACYEDTRMINAIIREARRRGVPLKVVDIPKELYVYKRRANGLSQHRSLAEPFGCLCQMTPEVRSADEFRGLLRLWWDFAKTPLRRLRRIFGHKSANVLVF